MKYADEATMRTAKFSRPAVILSVITLTAASHLTGASRFSRRRSTASNYAYAYAYELNICSRALSAPIPR